MRELLYHAQARKDLLEIRRYICKRSGDDKVARQFVDKLREQCQRLAELPGTLGRERAELRHGIRSFAFGNDVIFFQYAEQRIAIVTILEGHRDIEALFKEQE